MEIRKLDHIGIRVKDFAISTAFYKRFGFEVVREDYKERVVVIKHPGGIELNLLDSARDNPLDKNILMDVEARHTGYTHYALEVTSVHDVVDYLASIEVRITEGPVTFGDGKTSVFVRDPDLNVIEFTKLPESS